MWGPSLRIVAVLTIVVGVWVTSFQGRSAVVESQRRACEQGKLGDGRQSDSWWEAEDRAATLAYDPHQALHARAVSRDAAEVYGATAAWYEARSQRDCLIAYPDPGPFALR